MIFIATDILNPYKREILSQDSYNTLIDFLVEQFPDGFNRPTDISVNGHEVALADYDIELKESDVIVLLDRAALPVTLIGGWFITALANLAISVTLSYVANKLFAPDAPQEQGTPSSVYNLNSAQNAARYGSPVPIIYGKVRMFPSMIVQPYYKFEDNIEYLYHILCIGQGTNTASEVLIGDDITTNADDFQYKFLYQDSFYNIPLRAYGVHLSKTLSVPSTMEIKGNGGAIGDESEKYTISADASKIEFDYMYPNGLFYVKSDGSYYPTSSSFTFRLYTFNGTTYTEVFSVELLDNNMTIDAIQKTYTKDISSYNEPVYASFQRKSYYYHPRDTHDLYIKRVKEIYPNEDFTNLYGDITLLACKIKATNTVSSAGQLKINGYFTRTDVGNKMHEVLTDIYTNTTYGAGLSASDLDFPYTTETVDCAYDSNMTIFDAMRKPALAQGYSLYLAGMDLILKKDAPNAITSAMYNEMNILRNSFKAQYLFKEEYPAYDGFKCTYIDGYGWIQKSSTYPSISTRPKVVDLFGVVDWHLPVPHVLDLTITSPTQPIIVYAPGGLNYVDNGDGTWHVYSDNINTSGTINLYGNGNQAKVTKIVISSLYVNTCASLFLNMYSLTEVVLSGLDTTDVTSLYQMFYGCTSLTTIDMTVFRNNNNLITEGRGVFDGCSGLLNVNLSGIDMSSWLNFTYMFRFCSSLTCITNVDTRSGLVSSKIGMFTGCTSLTAPSTVEQDLITSVDGYNYVNPSPCP